MIATSGDEFSTGRAATSILGQGGSPHGRIVVYARVFPIGASQR
jgi:hypothetical protein